MRKTKLLTVCIVTGIMLSVSACGGKSITKLIDLNNTTYVVGEDDIKSIEYTNGYYSIKKGDKIYNVLPDYVSKLYIGDEEQTFIDPFEGIVEDGQQEQWEEPEEEPSGVLDEEFNQDTPEEVTEEPTGDTPEDTTQEGSEEVTEEPTENTPETLAE